MPKGVEHPFIESCALVDAAAIFPVMPKGVEYYWIRQRASITGERWMPRRGERIKACASDDAQAFMRSWNESGEVLYWRNERAIKEWEYRPSNPYFSRHDWRIYGGAPATEAYTYASLLANGCISAERIVQANGLSRWKLADAGAA